ncbi:MAG: M20/M25/M40 family metallo-hydrolase [Candidatus Diapherotrites archaeon]
MNYEIRFLRKLVSLNTDSETKENYSECAKLICDEAKKLGLKTKIINVSAKDKLPRPNIVIELNSGEKECMSVITHYDVVSAGDGWKTNPFKMRRKEDLLIGRGVNDDKGAIAAAFGAIKVLAKEKNLKRNIKLICACDEEVGGAYGIKWLTDNALDEIKSDFALVVDGSFTTVDAGCSGIIKGTIRLKGKQFHAGYPFRGPRIVHDSIPFLNDLLKYEEIMQTQVSNAPAPKEAPWDKVHGRFSITVLRAGKRHNIIPGRMRIGFDIRLIPEANVKKELDKFRRFARKLLKKYKLNGRVSLKGTDGYFIGENNIYALEIQKVGEKLFNSPRPIVCALGGMDGRFLARNDIPAISFGPGGGNAHEPNESIEIDNLKKVKELIIELTKKEEENIK